MEYESQKNTVLGYLKEHEYINDMICYYEFFITDLQHAIYELRKEGYPITDKWVHTRNKRGQYRKYKNYRLEKENGI